MPTVSEFLLERMKNAGINHVFGVPGDYVLNFYKKLEDSENIELVNCTDESHAGFAANAYSRSNGIGCVCTTYNVGSLKITNSVACAYAERCPVVVISGSPGLKERSEGLLLHHMVRSFECQKEVFQNLTCYSVVLDDPSTAGYKIDTAFEMLKRHKQPIYIELPRDIADKTISYDPYRQGTPKTTVSDPINLEESLSEVVQWIKNSKNPVILAGVQLSRFNLGNELLKFAEKNNIPIATTLLAKSLINEKHPLFAGIYTGNSSKSHVKELVDKSDCLLMFGVLFTDMTLMFMPSKFKKRGIVNVSIESLEIKNHSYKNVEFYDFCNELFKLEIDKKDFYTSVKEPLKSFIPTENKITCERLFEKINSILNSEISVIADVGDVLFGAADLVMHGKSTFIASAFYTSMGAAIPGSLGMLFANKKCRPLILVGDGAFQMSFSELSTIIKYNFNPIVIVLNNSGYATDRFVLDGDFNNIKNWNYHKYNELIGGGDGYCVNNEIELEEAFTKSINSKKLSLINVVVDKFDKTPGLKRMIEGNSLAK